MTWVNPSTFLNPGEYDRLFLLSCKQRRAYCLSNATSPFSSLALTFPYEVINRTQQWLSRTRDGTGKTVLPPPPHFECYKSSSSVPWNSWAKLLSKSLHPIFNSYPLVENELMDIFCIATLYNKITREPLAERERDSKWRASFCTFDRVPNAITVLCLCTLRPFAYSKIEDK